MTEARRFFIHCGLHKTGTTKIQQDLARNAAELEAAGLYLPHTFSKQRGAHHALAHAVRGPRFFRDQEANFTALARELAENAPGDICISSEDFETCLTRPRAMMRLLGLCDAAGARPVLVVYLRNQVDYFESLYLQLLRVGTGKSASEVLDTVCRDGQFEIRKYVFHFDFRAMAEAMRALPADVVLRNYHDVAGNDPTADFLALAGRGDVPLAGNPEGRANAARVQGNITRFVVNRQHPDDRSALAALDRVIDGKRPRLSPGAQARLVDRFTEANAWIAGEFGFDLNATFRAPDIAAGTPMIDRVFEDRTQDWATAALAGGAEAFSADKVAELCRDWFSGTAPEATL